jgi:hypothetical protein
MNDITDTRPKRPRAHLCCFDGCRVICIGEAYCWKHRPADVWAESRRTLDELQAQPVSHREEER